VGGQESAARSTNFRLIIVFHKRFTLKSIVDYHKLTGSGFRADNRILTITIINNSKDFKHLQEVSVSRSSQYVAAEEKLDLAKHIFFKKIPKNSARSGIFFGFI
jgi:hypothetical protein